MTKEGKVAGAFTLTQSERRRELARLKTERRLKKIQKQDNLITDLK